MKKITLLSFIFALSLFSGLRSQTVIWTENFGTCATSCANTGQLASAYSGANGPWTITFPTANDPQANQWFVSSDEAGTGANNCSSGCGISAALIDQSLHVGANDGFALDGGAAYDAGGICGFGICVLTDARAESPVINLTGQNTITLNFNYFEYGDLSNDDMEVWYFNGVTWALLFNPPKTLCCGGVTCTGTQQGIWTPFTIALPASANNNPNVKIGFHWKNNDDGVGTDPSAAVDDITLTVPGGAAPVPSFTLTGPVCSGTTMALTGSATNSPTSWAWSSNPVAGATILAPTNQNTSITFTAAGTYTVTLAATNGSGTNSTTQVIIVNPEPTVTVTPNPVTICSGSSQNLTASGATSYTWSPSTGLTCTSCVTTTASPTVTTTYQVIGISSGCDDTVSVPVTVTAAIVANATAASTTICNGSNTTLNATGGSGYVWAPAATLSNPNIANPTATPTVTTTYTVTVSSGSCPTATASITINVTAALTATANAASGSICSGSNTTLTATGGGTYSWAPAATLSNPNIANPTATPTTTTTYTVTITSGACPAATATVTVNVTAATVATATASATVICNGQTTNLTATGGGTYSWAPAGTLSNAAISNPVATPTVTTTYTVTVPGSGPCPAATASVTITVNGCIAPVALFTTSIDSVCEGGCIDYTSTSTGNPTSIQWAFQNGTPLTSATSPVTVCYPTAGTYSVMLIVTNANGKDTLIKVVKVNPNPVCFTILESDTIIYGTSDSITAGPGPGCVWSPSAFLSCTNCTTTVATPSTDMTYYATVTNQYGCVCLDTVTIVVDLKCGEVFVPNAFSPNGDHMNDVLHVKGNCVTVMNFILYDRWGEKVFESSSPSVGWDGVYNGKQMESAVFYYYLEATTIDGKIVTKKGNVSLIR